MTRTDNAMYLMMRGCAVPLNPGDDFAGYRVISSMGTGALGVSYLVESSGDPATQHVLTTVTTATSPDVAARVDAAAGEASGLSHPGIIAVREHGVAEGVPWFTVDRVEGNRLDAEPLSVAEVGAIVEQVAAALDHAHQRGVLHRDLTPASIIVARAPGGALGPVFVSEFGIAAALTADGAAPHSPYAAPETRSGRSDARSDQYSLAAIAYQRLTGTVPAPPAIAPVSALRPDAVALDPVFASALADDPGARFPDCRGFAAALTAGLRDEGPATPSSVPPYQGGPQGIPDGFVPVGGGPPTYVGSPQNPPGYPPPDPTQQTAYPPGGQMPQTAYPTQFAPAGPQFAGVPPTVPPGGPMYPGSPMYPGAPVGPQGRRKSRKGLWWTIAALVAVVVVAVAATTTVLLLTGNDEESRPDVVVSAGPASCAVIDAELFCWGRSGDGLLSEDSSTTSPPTRIENLTKVTTVSSEYDLGLGRGNICAVADKKLYCWGANTFGQLGNGTETGSTTPVQVPNLQNVTAVSTGYDSTCAVSDGKAYCWGDNGHGQLGNGAVSGDEESPQLVSSLTDVTDIDTDDGTSCAVAGGEVYCWGENDEGQLGNSNNTDVGTPTKIAGITGATSVETDDGTVCAVANSQAYCWGDNLYGQLGNGNEISSTSPVRIPELSDVTAISTGKNTTCAVAGGDAYCWGSNAEQQVGNNSTSDVSSPVKLTGLSGADAISTAEESSCAAVGQDIFCWGNNAFGQIGDSTTTKRSEPTKVTIPD